ncbi:hypothetical protein PG984_004811 [Apiospora sp. TS-2023a]
MLFAVVFWVAAGLSVVSYLKRRESCIKPLPGIEMTICTDSNVEEAPPPQHKEETYNESQQAIWDRLESIDDKINAIWGKLQEIACSSPVASHSAPATTINTVPHHDKQELGEGEEPLESPLTHPTDGDDGDAKAGYLIIW